MGHAWTSGLLSFFVGLVSIVNPLGVVPVFLSLTDEHPETARRAVARTTAGAVAVVLVVSVWAGDVVLRFFGIGVPAFRTGGGLLILVMALSMLHARRSQVKQSPAEAQEASARDDVAVVPLAIPLLAGPGAISLVVARASAAQGLVPRLGYSAAILLVAGLVWGALRLAVPLGRRLGVTGLNVATRIMGLLLAAIGVQMITAGLVELLPGLG